MVSLKKKSSGKFRVDLVLLYYLVDLVNLAPQLLMQSLHTPQSDEYTTLLLPADFSHKKTL